MRQSILTECFAYDPITGDLVWKRRPRAHFQTQRGWEIFNGKFAGAIAGTHDHNGHLQIKLFGKIHRAHRLVWILLRGSIPDGMMMDHINGVRDDNRIENLRLADASENCCNAKIYCNNSSGVKGVYWERQRGKWRARVRIHGRTIDVGFFSKLKDAERAIMAARSIAHGEFTNHGGI